MAGFRKRRKAIRKRKRSTRKRGAGAKMMQAAKMNVVNWKCTDVQPFNMAPNYPGNRDYGLLVVCMLNLFPNLLDPRYTPVIPIQNSNQLQTYQGMYDQFTITGVTLKVMIPPLYTRTQDAVPATLEWCYDEQDVPAPDDYPEMQVYANYQIQAVKPGGTYSRYFPTSALKKRLGIDYCSCQDAQYTYLGQLSPAITPAIYCRLRTTQLSSSENIFIASYAVTYHYRFRGLDFNNI